MSKICVVVGAGPGIGLAVAKRFAKEGFRLVLLSRRKEALQGYVDELVNQGAEAHALTLDAANFQSIQRAFDHIKVEIGDPNVLVYNAAVVKPGVPSELDPTDLMADFQVNVAAALLCAQQVIPRMRERKAGTLLFTGGGLALSPRPEYASLAIGKAGLRNLCQGLAIELEKYNIRVATVTVAGFVKPDTHFDPDLIAEKYWHLHTQPVNDGPVEIVYK